MKINKSDEATILIAVTEAINESEVLYYGMIRLPQDWERSFKSSLEKDFHNKLYSVLDDGGISSLIQREIMKEFFLLGLKLPEDGKYLRLISYKQFSDPLKIAKKILEIIKSLPRQYEVIARVCSSMAGITHPIPPLKIYDRMYLSSGENLRGHFPTQAENDRVDHLFCSYNGREDDLKAIDPAGLYLVYRTSGYISDRSSPKPLSDFYDDVRAFYGAAVSFGIFHRFTNPSINSSVAFVANEIDGARRSYIYRQGAEKDILDASRFYTTRNTDELLQEGKSLEQIFDRVIKLFNSPETRRLKTASIWLLRAYQAQRGMDQILDSTIAIEVLLGDREASDRVGLSKLMANRCAYSLGKTSEERKEIHDFFINFYRVRSDIVHSGRLKLVESERNVVRDGIDLAARILIHETDLSSSG